MRKTKLHQNRQNFKHTKSTLRGNALREYKQTITLNPIQREVLVGTLLGDASITLDRGTRRFCVKFGQTIESAEYIWHLYDILKNFVGTSPRVYNTRLGPARDYQSLRFQTYSHPEFKFYYDLFYPAHAAEGPGLRRKKRVPESIQQFLTSRALAYWFMDDGACMSRKSRSRTYIFHTQSFVLSDQGAKGDSTGITRQFWHFSYYSKRPFSL